MSASYIWAIPTGRHYTYLEWPDHCHLPPAASLGYHLWMVQPLLLSEIRLPNQPQALPVGTETHSLRYVHVKSMIKLYWWRIYVGKVGLECVTILISKLIIKIIICCLFRPLTHNCVGQDAEENGGGTYGNKEYGKKEKQHSRNKRWRGKSSRR